VENKHVDEARADGLFVFHNQYAYLPVHLPLRLALWRGLNSDSM